MVLPAHPMRQGLSQPVWEPSLAFPPSPTWKHPAGACGRFCRPTPRSARRQRARCRAALRCAWPGDSRPRARRSSGGQPTVQCCCSSRQSAACRRLGRGPRSQAALGGRWQFFRDVVSWPVCRTSRWHRSTPKGGAWSISNEIMWELRTHVLWAILVVHQQEKVQIYI